MNVDLMRQLADARGVSGQEEAPREVILAAIDGHVEDLRVDALGNVLARKAGSAGADLPRVLVTAHLDRNWLRAAQHRWRRPAAGLPRGRRGRAHSARPARQRGTGRRAGRVHVEADSPGARAEDRAAGQPARRYRRQRQGRGLRPRPTRRHDHLSPRIHDRGRRGCARQGARQPRRLRPAGGAAAGRAIALRPAAGLHHPGRNRSARRPGGGRGAAAGSGHRTGEHPGARPART